MEIDLLAPLLLAVKLCLYTSALLAAGLSLHAGARIIEPRSHPRILRLAAILGVAAIVFAAFRLALANVQLGGTISSIFDSATLSWTWPNLGPSTTSFALGGGALIVAAILGSAPLAALCSIPLAAGFALTGHTQALEPPGLAPWAVGFHMLIAAFWVAAPITLWPNPALSDETVTARAKQFSRFAQVMIPVLFALGLWLAIRLVGSANALMSSLYGQLLVAKLAGATAALALGAYNKQIVTQMLRDAPHQGRRALSLTLCVDAVLFAAVLIFIGVATTFTGPPST